MKHGVAIFHLENPGPPAREVVRVYRDGAVTGEESLANEIRDAITRGQYGAFEGPELIDAVIRHWNTMMYSTDEFTEVEDADEI